jgi:hypothetical protein
LKLRPIAASVQDDHARPLLRHQLSASGPFAAIMAVQPIISMSSMELDQRLANAFLIVDDRDAVVPHDRGPAD